MSDIIYKLFNKIQNGEWDTISQIGKKRSIDLADRYPRLIASHWYERRYGPGIDVIGRDWDNLILLDACRYDYFKSQIDLNGELESVISQGNYSWEFMKENFAGRELHDTMYITANPYAERLPEDTFFSIETCLDQWDEQIGTVFPEEVNSKAIEAYNKYPNKRLIIHYMQPHQPHIGQTADAIRERIDIKGWDRYHGDPLKSAERTGVPQWSPVRSGKIPESKIQQAYAESLDIVLQNVSKLIESIEGRTVISADHGEMLGERGVLQKRYGHPRDINNHALRKVPWFVINSDQRRNITTGNPIKSERISGDVVDSRLSALGYESD